MIFCPHGKIGFDLQISTRKEFLSKILITCPTKMFYIYIFSNLVWDRTIINYSNCLILFLT